MAGSRPETKPRDPLDAVVRRTRAGMALERGLRAFWPLGALLAALWAALAFGAADVLSRPALAGAGGIAVFGLLACLWRGLSRFRWPGLAEARARLDAGLPGRPLAALADRPALGRGDAAAEAVWAAHLRRMARIAAGARATPPDLRLAPHDPWALRLAALTALIAALVFARADPVAELTAALSPGDASAAAGGPSYEAWAEPPAYTGRPTLYLPEVAAEPATPLPEGTKITLRVYGDPARFAVTQDVADAGAGALASAASGIGVTSFDIDRSGAVALAEDGRRIAGWRFEMEPDAPPVIALAGPLERGPAGETELRFRAGDDHGVTAAEAEIALDLSAVDRRHGLAVDPAPRPPLKVELPLPGGRGQAEEEGLLVEDFSQHPWVGLPVTVRLTARDALGQTGTGEGRAIALPGKRFYNPLAAALAEQRRDLLWSPENAPQAAQILRAVTHRPEGLFKDERAYLMTRIAIRRIEAAPPGDAAALEGPAELLWRAALLVEEGDLSDAAERLARAKERLQEALRGDASDEEIAQLMQELREATQDYMRQMAEAARERGEEQAQGGGQGQSMTQDQIQALMDRIQELSEQGRRAEAEQLLEMLQQMLENMEMRFAQGGQGQGGPGGEGQGEQSMQDLGDALREQQNLADDSFQELQRQFREGRGQQDGGPRPEGSSRERGGDAQSLAERQEALRNLTEGLQRSLPGEAGETVREALREAERRMGEAEQALREGDAAGALDRQSQAIDGLRQGMREMAENMRGERNGDQSGAQGGEGQALSDGSQDPLGRPLGAQGSIGTDQNMVPEPDAAARARGLLDEIRRRSGDQARPQIELDYLRRLLDRF